MNQSIEKGRADSAVPSVSPLADVYENDDEYRIVLDVPGANEKSVDITLDRDQLTLMAVRHPDSPNAVRYVRTFSIPDGVDRDRVEASLTQGVLTLTLPKRETVKPRTIRVRAA